MLAFFEILADLVLHGSDLADQKKEGTHPGINVMTWYQASARLEARYLGSQLLVDSLDLRGDSKVHLATLFCFSLEVLTAQLPKQHVLLHRETKSVA